jgi:hypothetical protein
MPRKSKQLKKRKHVRKVPYVSSDRQLDADTNKRVRAIHLGEKKARPFIISDDVMKDDLAASNREKTVKFAERYATPVEKIEEAFRFPLSMNSAIVDRVFLSILADRLESGLPATQDGQRADAVVSQLRTIASCLTTLAK